MGVQTWHNLIVIKCEEILIKWKNSWTFHQKIPMMLNCFGIDKCDKLHGFIMYGVIWAIGCVSPKYYYSFQFSNAGSYAFRCDQTWLHSESVCGFFSVVVYILLLQNELFSWNHANI